MNARDILRDRVALVLEKDRYKRALWRIVSIKNDVDDHERSARTIDDAIAYAEHALSKAPEVADECGDPLGRAIKNAVEAARADERERCAKMLEERDLGDVQNRLMELIDVLLWANNMPIPAKPQPRKRKK